MILDREILEFKVAANEVRRDIIEMIYRSHSGHPGPSLSCVEILLALYQDVLTYHPDNPHYPLRDRFVLSKGHAAPTLYAMLARFYNHIEREMVYQHFRSGWWEDEHYRDTPFQGHPDMNLLPGVELSAGSLGNGLGYACSLATELQFRFMQGELPEPLPWVFCLIGDGEIDEGSTREAIAYAGAKRIGNLVVIVDNNRQQLTGKKEEILNFGQVRDQFNEKQWQIIDNYRGGEDLNGHDYQHLRWAYEKAMEDHRRPTVIIAYTIKGKGVSFMEDDAAYHGVPPKEDEYHVCMKIFDITERIYKKRLAEMNKTPNHILTDKSFVSEEMVAPREAYGRALYHLGKQNKRIIRIDADLRSSCKGDYFHSHFPERSYEVGIAETTMSLLAAAFGREGEIPFINTFSVFYLKAMEVIRNVIAYNKCNVKIVASHGDPRLMDGGSHAEVEMLGVIRSIPNLALIQPADGIMTYRLVFEMAKYQGPVYMRFGRDKIPIIYNGKQNPLFGSEVDNPFDITPRIGKGHLLKAGTHATIVAIGDMVFNALVAGAMLEKEGISCSIIDMYSIKPLDQELLLEHADKPILTVEPHNIVGGLGSAVSESVCSSHPQRVIRMGIDDHFTKSGKAEDLTRRYGLTPQHIADGVRKMLKSTE